MRPAFKKPIRTMKQAIKANHDHIVERFTRMVRKEVLIQELLALPAETLCAIEQEIRDLMAQQIRKEMGNG